MVSVLCWRAGMYAGFHSRVVGFTFLLSLTRMMPASVPATIHSPKRPLTCQLNDNVSFTVIWLFTIFLHSTAPPTPPGSLKLHRLLLFSLNGVLEKEIMGGENLTLWPVTIDIYQKVRCKKLKIHVCKKPKYPL